MTRQSVIITIMRLMGKRKVTPVQIVLSVRINKLRENSMKLADLQTFLNVKLRPYRWALFRDTALARILNLLQLSHIYLKTSPASAYLNKLMPNGIF